MDIFDILDPLDKREKALLLYSLLNRLPIIIFGSSSDKIDQFIIELIELINFRKDLVFNTDFISYSEFHALIENETNDYNMMRIQVRCSTSSAMKALKEFVKFESIIIGFKIKNDTELVVIKDQINQKENNYLEIFIEDEQISIKMEYNHNSTINTSLEQNIFKKITENTEVSIDKMKRVLSESIIKEGYDGDLKNILLDLESEKREIKKNILHKEIKNFYAGSKRAFFLLSKLDLLNNMNIGSKIGSKTLLETIDYHDAPIERILSFINKEWGHDFSYLIENNKLTFIGEKIQSFWG
ncbi:MAG: hypothetical protein EU547_05245 [Promethearchaeota archaeon]|nr:MAG: hypothetical protein EU547_05245 [Candidatus Lokiarchaeota archaeon]